MIHGYNLSKLGEEIIILQQDQNSTCISLEFFVQYDHELYEPILCGKAQNISRVIFDQSMYCKEINTRNVIPFISGTVESTISNITN